MARRILVVAQAFKGSLSAGVVARAIAAGVRLGGGAPDVIVGSDGGDGLLQALEPAALGRSEHETVDPLGRPIRVPVLWLDRGTALIESRMVIGLSLLAAHERNPSVTTTRGLGLLIEAVRVQGAGAVVVGLGGSATVDGGLGMARPWGWVPLDRHGRELPEGGGALQRLERLRPGRRPPVTTTALCDVTTPLVGAQGAAQLFARQKGARPEDVPRLAAGLARLARVVEPLLGREVALLPGSGAAGGVGFGLVAFAGAHLVPGARWVLERAEFGERLARAHGVVVCEGAFDRTSLAGKLTGVVIGAAAEVGRRVVLLAPAASDVPTGVLVESGGGAWDAATLEDRARRGVERLLRAAGA